jgi:hypothetical protein
VTKPERVCCRPINGQIGLAVMQVSLTGAPTPQSRGLRDGSVQSASSTGRA